MAERIIRQLIDDLDGTEIAEGGGEQIEFSFRGVAYRIDLNKNNVAKLEKALAPFIDSAAKLNGPRKSARGRRSSAPARRRSKDKLVAIRAWANETGHHVSARGRIARDVVEAYEAAHRRNA